MNPVTDPNLLAQLNQPMPVTDPSILAQLNDNTSDLGHAAGVALSTPVRGVGSLLLGAFDAGAKVSPWLSRTFTDTPVENLPSLNDAYQKQLTEWGFPEPRNKPEQYINAGGQGLVAGVPGMLAGIGGQAFHDLPLSPDNIKVGDKDIGISPQDIATTAGGLLGGSLGTGPKSLVMNSEKIQNSNQARLAQTLMKEGVPTYLSDVLPEGSLLKKSMNFLDDLPFSGSGSRNAARQEALNSAAISKMGVQGNQLTPPLMAQASDQAGAVFNRIGENNTLTQGQRLGRALDYLEADANQNMVGDSLSKTLKEIDKVRMGIKSDNSMSGNAYLDASQSLGALSRRSTDPEVSNSASMIKGTLDDAMAQELSPQDLKDFTTARGNYRNMLALEKAAGKNVVGGDISPADLQMGVSKIFPNYEYNDPNSLPQLTQAAQLLRQDSATPVLNLRKMGLLGEALQAGVTGASPLLGPLARALNRRLTPSDFRSQ